MRQFFKSILRDQGGNVLPLGAAGVMLLLVVVGSGLEMSRAYRANARLQSACDAATLAGRRAVGVNGFDTTARAVANSYFNTNFDQTAQEAQFTKFSLSSPDNGITVSGTATTRVSTLIMKVFGVSDLPLTATCSASMGVGNSDVTFVLDVSGSMGGALAGTTTTRLQALQTAMKNFYTTVNDATGSSNARVRYSMVPYSSNVNVGRLVYARNPIFVDDVVNVQSRVPIFRTINEQVLDGWSDPVSTTTGVTFNSVVATNQILATYLTYPQCVPYLRPVVAVNVGSPTTRTEVTINASGQQVTRTIVTQPQSFTETICPWWAPLDWVAAVRRTGTRNQVTTTTVTRNPIYRNVTRQEFDRWDYRRVTYDTSLYKASWTIALPLGANGTNQLFTWSGCLEERQTVNAASFSFSGLTGISPSGARDLDIDSAPVIWDPASKWRPMLEGAAYYRVTTDGGSTLTANATSLYGRLAGADCPVEARLLAPMSQGEFFGYVDSLAISAATYHDLGMIWGARLSSPDGIFGDLVKSPASNGGETARHIIFMTDGGMAPSNLNHSAYGIEWHDRRVSSTGLADADLTNRHNSRFLAVCEAVKAKGIRVWTVAFSTALTPQLQACASPNSSFAAADSAQLDVAFQEIANKVGELRVVQ